MDFFPLIPKEQHSCASPSIPTGHFVGQMDLSSLHVIVRCSYDSVRLNRMGCFGMRAGEHNDYMCLACFGKESNGNERKQTDVLDLPGDDPVRTWKELTFGDRDLRLSPEEVIHLVWDQGLLTVEGYDVFRLWQTYVSRLGKQFVARCALYNQLRKREWVPKSGISLGCDFAIYRHGPNYYHSSAGVKIVDRDQSIDDCEFQSLTRSLSNMRKAIVIVTANVPDNMEYPECLHNVELKDVATAGRWEAPNVENALLGKFGTEDVNDESICSSS